MYRLFIIFVFSFISWTQAQADTFDHSAWDQLLKQHVYELSDGKTTEVDYDGFVEDKIKLTNYLNTLSAINKSEFENWSEDEQLAFLINAYNAWTVNLVLTGYPKIDSIRDLGNIIFTPFGKDIVSLFGEQISLDDIEKDLILNNFKESRIHFALNCASISCPSLKTEAYDGERLEKQLHDQMATFLSDKKRNYLDGNNLRVSSIFKWYDDDFEDSDASINEIEDYFIKHSELFDSSSADTQKIKSGEFKIKFLKYDWNLNKRN